MSLQDVRAKSGQVRGLETSNELTIARATLTRAMVEARKQGFTMQQIAEAAGVTRQRVHQLLNKEGT